MDGETRREPGVDLMHYIRVLNRRKWHFVVAFAVVMGVAAAFAFLLPPEYRSEATIMIERQEIPSNLVSTTVQGYIQERIKGLSEEIMTRERLLDLIERFDLYPEERARGVGEQELVREFKQAVKVDMLSVKTASPDSPKIGLATIAFTVSFGYPDPQKSRDVTEALAELFLKENQIDRARKAAEVTAFLEQQARDLNEEISRLEAKLAEFKQERRDSLPELMSMNQRLFEKAQSDIAASEEKIRGLQDRIRSLTMELSLTSPYRSVVNEKGERLLSPEERLGMLTAEYLQLLAKYSQQHPDVKRLRREIRLLSGENRDLAATARLVDDLQTLHTKLARASARYAPDHPEVVKLKRAISSVERSLRQFALQAPGAAKTPASAPDNPRYVALQSELVSAQNELQAERNRLEELQDQRDEYQKRLFETPLVERDYNLLSRDYENAKRKYAEIREKLLDARMAQELEQQSKGERFTILNHAFFPSLPESPNRLGILALGILLATLAGIGAVGVAEYLDTAIHGVEDVRALCGAPPLAVIPEIQAPQASHRKQADQGSTVKRPKAA